jgi:hypothetical protein
VSKPKDLARFVELCRNVRHWAREGVEAGVA